MPDELKLGTVIASRNHIDYFISIYRDGEVSPDPKKEDFSMGKFVKIGNGDMNLIGMVISSQVLSDDGLRTGLHTHSMPTSESTIFTPELVNGALMLIQVRGIGVVGSDGNVTMGLPSFSPSYHDPVFSMGDEEVVSMHTRDGILHLEYLRELRMKGDVETHRAVIDALTHLSEMLPDHTQIIDLIRQEMIWNRGSQD